MKKIPEAPELGVHVWKLLVLMKKDPDLPEGGVNILNTLLKMEKFSEHLGQVANVLLFPGHPELLPAVVEHTPDTLPRQVPPSPACYNLSTSLLLLSEVVVCTPTPTLHKDEYTSQMS